MKKVIILLTIIAPITCTGRFGWSFENYSILTGPQYRFGQRPFWNIEFQYDKYSQSCLHQSHYFGLGVNYSFTSIQTKLGIKGMWNPTRFKLVLSRTAKFHPYLFAQGNFIQTKSLNKISEYGFRSGLGFTGNFRDDKILCIRATLQACYDITNGQHVKKPLILEFKIGVGINTRRLKRNKQAEEINQTETQ